MCTKQCRKKAINKLSTKLSTLSTGFHKWIIAKKDLHKIIFQKILDFEK